MAKKQVLDVYLSKIIKSQEHTGAAAVAAAKEGKQPKEILDSLKDSTQEARNTQKQQIKLINQTVDKMSSNYQKRITQISSKAGSIKQQIALDNYWLLLSHQVKQKIMATIVKKQNEYIKKIAGDNPELQKVINILNGSKDYMTELQTMDANVKKAKETAKKAQSEMKKEGEDDTGKEHKVEAGQIYNIDADDSGETTKLEILKVGEDGSIKFKATESGKKYSYKPEKHQKQIDKLTKDTLEKKEEKPVTAEA